MTTATGFARWMLRSIAVLLVAAVAAALLAGAAPGSGVDERELDSRLSSQSIQKLRAERAAERSPLLVMKSVFRDAARGEAGTSALYQIRISELLKGRAALSLRYLLGGMLLAWFAAAALVLLEQAVAARLSLVPRVIAAILLMVPAAALAEAIGLVTAAAPYLCMAAVVFSRVYTVSSEILRKSSATRHSFYAYANGMAMPRRLFFSILPEAAPELLALLGLSVNIAIGALIVVEAVCDQPGLGRLAIEAAMARDTRVVIVLTVMICAITQLANSHSRFWIKRRQWL